MGSDARFVVAKQHPSDDLAVTKYFVVDKRKADERILESAVTGPLTESEFRASAVELGLPPFSRVLDSLV